MIIIINKLYFHSKHFCENCVTGSNLGEEMRPDALTTTLSHGEREKGVKHSRHPARV